MDEKVEKNFLDLLEKNQKIIHKICRIYSNEEEYKDLFQEIVIQLWKSYSSFKGESKFTTWMYSVSLNTAMSLFRKVKKHETNINIELVQDKIKHDEINDDDEIKVKKMYQAIHQLNDVDKALIMMYLDDKDYSEISRILGITEGNARVKMNRARNKLKQLIKNR
jgi:RNA polymerase sigma-70 factor (ECF subfamily)